MTDAERIKQLELEVENLRLRIQWLESRPHYVPVPNVPQPTPMPGTTPWLPTTTLLPPYTHTIATDNTMCSACRDALARGETAVCNCVRPGVGPCC